MIFLDRSGWETYHQRCAFRYYLERHAGPTQHGIVPRYAEIPLMTGSLVHAPAQAVNEAWLQLQTEVEAHGAILDPVDALHVLEPIARRAIAQARARYLETVKLDSLNKTRGMSAAEADALGLPVLDSRVSDEERAHEQCSLLEGFTLIYLFHVLPELMQRGRIIWVEQEAVRLLADTCTCGQEHNHNWMAHGEWVVPEGATVRPLPAQATLVDYLQAGYRFRTRCDGVFLSATPDLILERYADGGLEYHETKTQAGEGRVEQWTYKPQFLAGAFCAEPELFAKIETFYVHLWLKGELKKTYEQATGGYTGPKRQHSSLCYVYYRPAVPPTQTEDWQPKYEWTTEDGYKKRLGPKYQKQPLWTQTFSGMLPEGMSPVEFWIRAQGPEGLGEHYRMIGPLGPQAWMQDEWIEGVRQWGMDVQSTLQVIRQRTDGTHPVAPQLPVIASTFPQSWDCFPFKEQTCPFLWVCGKQPGWQEPWRDDEKTQFRRPHHLAEREYAVSIGRLALETLTAETNEEEE